MKNRRLNLQNLSIKSFITAAGKREIAGGGALQEDSESVKPQCGTGEADCTWKA